MAAIMDCWIVYFLRLTLMTSSYFHVQHQIAFFLNQNIHINQSNKKKPFGGEIYSFIKTMCSCAVDLSLKCTILMAFHLSNLRLLKWPTETN